MRISSTDPPTPYRARVRDEEPVFLGEFYRPSNDDEASERKEGPACDDADEADGDDNGLDDGDDDDDTTHARCGA